MSADLLNFSMKAGLLCPFQYLWGVSVIVAKCSDHHTLVWWNFPQDICPLFSPLSWGVSNFLWRTAPILQATSQEVCTVPSVSLFLLRIRCQWAVFILSNVFFVSAIFTSVPWLGEDKIEVLQEIVSNVLGFFYYRLTFSCSDFAKFHTC